MLPLLMALILGCSSDSDHWYFRTDGVDLPVRVDGKLDSGLVLLMLHGGPAGSSVYYNWGKDTELIEDEFAVAYYDQRGQGGTHGAYSRDRLTVAQLATDNANLVRAIRARYGDDTEVWLYGHSWGGMLGTATLLDTDAEVDGWIEASGSHDYPANDIYTAELLLEVGAQEIAAGSEHARQWRDIIDTVENALPGGIDRDEAVANTWLGHEAEGYVEQHWPEGTTDEESLLEIIVEDPTAVITGAWSGWAPGRLVDADAQNYAYTDRLHEITVPSLFLYGDLDFVCPAQLGRDAHERVSTEATEFVLFEDAGHSPMSNYPEEYAQAIIDFVHAWR